MIIILILLLFTTFVFAGQNFNYDAKGKRDPLLPLISKGGIYASDAYGIKGIKDIRLEGIVWDESKGSIAIINGEIVREGEEIGVAKVLRIEKDAVVFDVDNEEVRVELNSE